LDCGVVVVVVSLVFLQDVQQKTMRIDRKKEVFIMIQFFPKNEDYFGLFMFLKENTEGPLIKNYATG
jgi:hypothetical protein